MNVRSGLQLIPTGAKITAAVIFVAITAGLSWFFGNGNFVNIGAVTGSFFGALAAAFILLAGYVYADAKRRGMPAIAWTALAILVPNGLGFVLYFLLRKPIVHPCSGCGTGVAPDACFCPRCGHAQMAA